MIINDLNGVWLDTYILQIMIQQELEKLTKIFKENLILKANKFQSKLEIFTKLKKKKKKKGLHRYLLMFLVMKLRKNIKSTFKRLVDLLLIRGESKRHYVHINDFITFMYDYTLYYGRKHFYRYCLQVFNTKGILKCHVNDCFKINGKKRIKKNKMTKKSECVTFKDYERNIKSPLHGLCRF